MSFIYLDYPTNRSYGFQDPASNSKYGIMDLHDSILFYLIILLILVSRLLLSTFFNPDHLPFLRHGNAIEIIWTVSPALILWFIAIPSLKLLYLLDEI
jgi:cytochrome c oxidase subunit 2